MPSLVPISLTDGLLQSYLNARSLGCTSREPALLVCWPYGRNNRYQDLLYSSSLDYRISICPITTLEQLEEISWPGPLLFHAHWFASLYVGRESESDALEATDSAFQKIEAFRNRTNSTLLWTAHNLFPHNTVFPGASLELRQRILRTFDAVHILAESHLEALVKAYGLSPKRTFVVPHMLYNGVYPNYVDGKRARQILGISPTAFVYGFFGSIQAYKGVDTLVKEFQYLIDSGRRDAVLLIAGSPASRNSGAFLENIPSTSTNILLDVRRIPDDQVQLFFNASDIMVFPYADTLNSGAASLAVTFSKRMIVPRTEAFREFSEFGATFYDIDANGSLLEQLILGYDRRDAPVVPSPYPISRLSEAISRLFFERVIAGGLL